MVDGGGKAIIALEKGMTGRRAATSTLKTCCCSVLKNGIELSTSLGRFTKSVSCCNLVANMSKSSGVKSSPNIKNGAETFLES